MRIFIFIVSNVLLITAIVMVTKHKGHRFLGLNLSKRWTTSLIICELIIAILSYVSYIITADVDIANDMLWNSLIANYRGVLPIVGLMQIIDFKISNSEIVQLFLMFLGALVSDYIILKAVTLLKRKSKI